MDTFNVYNVSIVSIGIASIAIASIAVASIDTASMAIVGRAPAARSGAGAAAEAAGSAIRVLIHLLELCHEIQPDVCRYFSFKFRWKHLSLSTAHVADASTLEVLHFHHVAV